jgi:hypothetical protein
MQQWHCYCMTMSNTIAYCHIEWLYLAANGCKTYLNLNLNLNTMKRVIVRQPTKSESAEQLAQNRGPGAGAYFFISMPTSE